MSQADELEDELDALDTVITAAEKWTDVYTKSPKSHAKLIKIETKIKRVMRKHFRELAHERLPRYINWTNYHNEMIRAFDVNIIFDDTSFMNEEDSIMLNVLYDPILAGMGAGIAAGQDIYHDIGMSESTASVLKAARDQSAQLVTKIDETTRDRIQQSIETSLTLGESTSDAAARLSDLIDDPYRAEMIARTEAVNSYTQGLLSFGDQSGAKTKVWQALAPEDEDCDIDGEEVDISDTFSNDLDGPPVHPNCRCGLQLTYDTGDGEVVTEDDTSLDE